jgi:hypothetical protein
MGFSGHSCEFAPSTTITIVNSVSSSSAGGSSVAIAAAGAAIGGVVVVALLILVLLIRRKRRIGLKDIMLSKITVKGPLRQDFSGVISLCEVSMVRLAY